MRQNNSLEFQLTLIMFNGILYFLHPNIFLLFILKPYSTYFSWWKWTLQAMFVKLSHNWDDQSMSHHFPYPMMYLSLHPVRLLLKGPIRCIYIYIYKIFNRFNMFNNVNFAETLLLLTLTTKKKFHENTFMIERDRKRRGLNLTSRSWRAHTNNSSPNLVYQTDTY